MATQKTVLYMNVHSSISHNSQNEIVQMSTNWWMNEQIFVYAYNGIFYSHKNKDLMYAKNYKGMNLLSSITKTVHLGPYKKCWPGLKDAMIGGTLYKHSHLSVSTGSASVDWISIGCWLNSQMQNLQIWRTNCTIPFYIKDLSIHRFWCPWVVLDPIIHCGY